MRQSSHCHGTVKSSAPGTMPPRARHGAWHRGSDSLQTPKGFEARKRPRAQEGFSHQGVFLEFETGMKPFWSKYFYDESSKRPSPHLKGDVV